MTSNKHRRQVRPTVNVYVDGFNLYYGCLKGTKFKWLDLDQLFRKLLPQHEIKRIRYFTARISARPDDPDSPTRQDAYLRALKTLPNVTIHLGKFLQSPVRMPLVNPRPGHKTVEVLKTEEKGSDVNLATYLLIDAFRGDSDIAVVVSNDSDLCEPIRVVSREFNVPVGLLIPHNPHELCAQQAQARLHQADPLWTAVREPVPGNRVRRARAQDPQAFKLVAPEKS